MRRQGRDQAWDGCALRCGLAPKTARRIGVDVAEEDMPLTDVHVGDLLRVMPGEKAPVNGIVLEDESAVDESADGRAGAGD